MFIYIIDGVVVTVVCIIPKEVSVHFVNVVVNDNVLNIITHDYRVRKIVKDL